MILSDLLFSVIYFIIFLRNNFSLSLCSINPSSASAALTLLLRTPFALSPSLYLDFYFLSVLSDSVHTHTVAGSPPPPVSSVGLCWQHATLFPFQSSPISLPQPFSHTASPPSQTSSARHTSYLQSARRRGWGGSALQWFILSLPAELLGLFLALF